MSLLTRARPLMGAAPWAALLAASAIVGSWALACVLPFAAFAVIAARTLPLRSALLTVALVWLANQAVGFLVLAYPGDTTTLLWGVALLVAALLATIAAAAMQARSGGEIASVLVAFAASFIVYEAVLLLTSLALGGGEAFSPAIVWQVLEINALWLAALYLASLVLSAGAPALRRTGDAAA